MTQLSSNAIGLPKPEKGTGLTPAKASGINMELVGTGSAAAAPAPPGLIQEAAAAGVFDPKVLNPAPKLTDAERVAELLGIVEKQQALLQDLANRLAELDMANASLVNEMMKTKGIGPYAGQRQEPRQQDERMFSLAEFMQAIASVGKQPGRQLPSRRPAPKPRKGVAAKKSRKKR